MIVRIVLAVSVALSAFCTSGICAPVQTETAPQGGFTVAQLQERERVAQELTNEAPAAPTSAVALALEELRLIPNYQEFMPGTDVSRLYVIKTATELKVATAYKSIGYTMDLKTGIITDYTGYFIHTYEKSSDEWREAVEKMKKNLSTIIKTAPQAKKAKIAATIDGLNKVERAVFLKRLSNLPEGWFRFPVNSNPADDVVIHKQGNTLFVGIAYKGYGQKINLTNGVITDMDGFLFPKKSPGTPGWYELMDRVSARLASVKTNNAMFLRAKKLLSWLRKT